MRPRFWGEKLEISSPDGALSTHKKLIVQKSKNNRLSYVYTHLCALSAYLIGQQYAEIVQLRYQYIT